MKLRDEVLQGESIFGNAEFWGVGLDSPEKIYGPMTSNVVGNLNRVDLLIFDCGKEDIVYIDEPN